MRNALVAIVALALAGCGGPVDSNNDGDEDSSTDGPDIHVDLPTDTPTDSPTDSPTDTEEDSVPGCVTHQDCLPSMFCGPCTYTRCPCDPETMMGCEPRCEENPCWDGSTAECPDLVCPIFQIFKVLHVMQRILQFRIAGQHGLEQFCFRHHSDQLAPIVDHGQRGHTVSTKSTAQFAQRGRF